jgi:hypothetical protein
MELWNQDKADVETMLCPAPRKKTVQEVDASGAFSTKTKLKWYDNLQQGLDL